MVAFAPFADQASDARQPPVRVRQRSIQPHIAEFTQALDAQRVHLQIGFWDEYGLDRADIGTNRNGVPGQIGIHIPRATLLRRAGATRVASPRARPASLSCRLRAFAAWIFTDFAASSVGSSNQG
ncbi:hypothetical protein [Novosphingobium sp.]|uniref:hypothetical protein n=1 Tax=Novosphingobium sp. TaxID=1874826 RepID=UPI003B520047